MNEKIASILVNLNRSLLRNFPAVGFDHSSNSFGEHHAAIFLSLPLDLDLEDDEIQMRYFRLLYPYFDFLSNITICWAEEIEEFPWKVDAVKL